jgi:hypothetical protein
MGKELLLRNGILPLCIHASATAVSVARHVINDGVNAKTEEGEEIDVSK